MVRVDVTFHDREEVYCDQDLLDIIQEVSVSCYPSMKEVHVANVDARLSGKRKISLAAINQEELKLLIWKPLPYMRRLKCVG